MGRWDTQQMPVPSSSPSKPEEHRRKQTNKQNSPTNQPSVKSLLGCQGGHSLADWDLVWPFLFTLRALQKLSPANCLSAACLLSPYMLGLVKLGATGNAKHRQPGSRLSVPPVSKTPDVWDAPIFHRISNGCNSCPERRRSRHRAGPRLDSYFEGCGMPKAISPCSATLQPGILQSGNLNIAVRTLSWTGEVPWRACILLWIILG